MAQWTVKEFSARSKTFAEHIFDEVRAISHSPAPLTGVTRTSYSPKEAEVLDYLTKVSASIGLEIEKDPAGNVWATLPGREKELPAVVAGSHVDSVPDGGNFDGLAGIVAALCVANWMKSTGFVPRRDFRVVLIRAEEEGLFGTLAMMGALTQSDLERRFQTDGPTVAELMAQNGIDPQPLTTGTPVVDFTNMAAFFEVHIEQSARLDEAKDERLGIVTGIRGLVRHRTIRAIGETAHAGAVDFPYRHDAAFACARFASKLYDAWQHELALGRDLVATTGVITTSQSAAMNKIAGDCMVSLDARSLSARELDHVVELVDGIIREVAQEARVTIVTDPLSRLEPVESDPELMARLESAAKVLSVGSQRLPSGAGHDAMNFSAAGVPFAMLFIANRYGSHNPKESMEIDDFINAAAVLTRTVMEFDDE